MVSSWQYSEQTSDASPPSFEGVLPAIHGIASADDRAILYATEFGLFAAEK